MKEDSEKWEEEMLSLKGRVSELESSNFNALALDIFRFQAEFNPLYKTFLSLSNCHTSLVKTIQQIPFLPIELFKNYAVQTGFAPIQFTFESSGTTGQTPSKLPVTDPSFYLSQAKGSFEREYGSLDSYHIFALLPSYLERSTSSLVCMMDYFIQESYSEFSGFYLNQYADLTSQIKKALESNRKIWLMGVTFGLLDWVDSGQDFSFWRKAVEEDRLVVMETGGMKGRREEWIRDRVHEYLKEKMGLKAVGSEYGMTELFSQAYAKHGGIFTPANSMRILLREVTDPLALIETPGRVGGIKVVDLANIDTCAFIETRDLGSLESDGINFKVLGRFDNAEMRGCSLMVTHP